MFEAMNIRDAIGEFADGGPVNPKYIDTIKRAVVGAVQTTDRGIQIFAVSVHAANQHNVDTEELIWPNDPECDLMGTVPLEAISNSILWTKAEKHWQEEDPISWAAFVWRVAVPIANRLRILGSWEQ